VPSSVPVVAAVDMHTHSGGGLVLHRGGGVILHLPAGGVASGTGGIGKGGEVGGDAHDDDAPSRPHRAFGCTV
jgi:hypothetical protein